MGDQAVPWAVGRRALVLWPHTGLWLEAVGGLEDKPVWYVSRLDGDREGDPKCWASDDWATTAILPGQCIRCYLTEGHAPGCMVEDNIKRGVPAFWAPFVMQDPPPTGSLCYGVIGVHLIELQRYRRPGVSPVVWEGWETPNGVEAEEIEELLGFVALGPEGPTIQPWAAGSGEVGG